MTDISFHLDTHKFNYRVAAVIEHNQQYLLTTISQADFWFLPGGRVKIGETSQEALGREIQEELGVSYKGIELLWLVENFFTLDNQAFHEMSFYYSVTVSREETSVFRKVFTREPDLEFRWFDAAELESVDLRPEFLKTRLLKDKNEFEHIVFRDDGR